LTAIKNAIGRRRRGNFSTEVDESQICSAAIGI
jgi:hypothetical protein